MPREPSDSPASVRSAESEFKLDMREFGHELGKRGSVSPEVLADRFHKMAISVSERWPVRSEQRSRYLAGVRMQVRMDIGMSAAPNPLYERFLTRLLALLEETSSAPRI